jgi:hypothetical protein
VAGIVGIVALLWLFDASGGHVACGHLPVRVRGTVTDAETGSPIEGVDVLTLHDPRIAQQPMELRWRRDLARHLESCTREGLIQSCASVGSARTDASGAFEIIVGIGTSENAGRFGIVWHRERGSAFDVARALLVEKEGYAPQVHETKDARWVEQPDGEIVGTLEVGTIRLARR